MKRIVLIQIILIITLPLVSCGTLSSTEHYQPTDLLLKDVNIIPMTKEIVLENVSVFIHNGKIAEIGNFEDLDYPEDTTIIDCTGKYLVPGFADMHVHVQYPQEMDLFLANGITSIRNMFGTPEVLELRRAIEQKDILGPEVFTTGPLIDGRGARWPGSTIITDPREVPGIVAEMKDDGYDAIKVYDELTLEVYDAVIAAARSENIPVVGHVPHNVAFEHVIESGQVSIEHFSGFDYETTTEDVISLTVDSGIWISTALVLMEKIRRIEELNTEDIPELKYVHPVRLSYWQNFPSHDFHFERYKEILVLLYNRGANFVAASDAGNPYVIPGFSLHEEFRHMQDAGLSPYQILLTTTVNPSRMLGIEDRSGTIGTGKDADLVLLDKNPLLDIGNTKSIAGVVTKGYWLSREDLQRLLDDVEEYNQ